ncbi:restriction endonuclease subunit S [Eubacterium sp.]|uniref:restriction endonuclease subunit S n=1 Tax=Eubacterium sp. TaxID=142586 RepID=UPI0026DF6E91|nr:restriction endonuclease subunit S [Eubacterium sp.]MDO5433768.1 restriction endonuclease subunit S [Eubacterium sp.]
MVKEWPRFPIGEILDFKNGLNKGKEFFGFGTPIINYTDVYHNSGIKAKDVKGKVSLSKDEIRRFEVRKNDVFFTRTSETPEEVGLSAVLLEDIQDCVFSGFVLRGRPKNDKLVGEYCKYCFSTKHVREEIVKNCTYTTRALTNGKVLSAIEIPVPLKEEQEKIADALSAFEQYIDDLAELIEKKKGIRDGALEDLVSGKTRINGFSSERKEYSINDITRVVITGGTPSTAREEYYNGDIPWLASTEIHQKRITKPTTYITELGLSNSSAKIAPENSVLIALAGQGKTRGTVAYLTKPMALNQSLAALVTNEKCNSEFLYYMIESMYVPLRELSSGGGRGGLNKKLIKGVIVTIPVDVDEQEAIAKTLLAMDEEIRDLEAEREKIIRIREGAMDDLLTGRVRLTT